MVGGGNIREIMERKEAFNHAQARSILLEESAKQFDRDVIDDFLATEDKFVEACENNADATETCALLTVIPERAFVVKGLLTDFFA